MKQNLNLLNAGERRLRLFACGLSKIIACLFLWTLSANGATVTLAWDPSPDTSVAGYTLYYGTSSANYSQLIDVGNQTTTTITNLTVGGNYYFAVTAHNALGLESPPSNEVAYNIPSTVATNQAPGVNAGPDQTVFVPATANLQGTVTDDGLPTPPASFTSIWSILSGPGSVSFNNANALTTTASFSTTGTYVLRLTAFDGALTSTDDLIVTVTTSQDPAPFISSFTVTAQGPTLAWTSVPGRLYRVVYKDTFNDPQWNIASADLTAIGNSLNWVDASAASSSQRFYSVVLLP